MRALVVRSPRACRSSLASSSQCRVQGQALALLWNGPSRNLFLTGCHSSMAGGGDWETGASRNTGQASALRRRITLLFADCFSWEKPTTHDCVPSGAASLWQRGLSGRNPIPQGPTEGSPIVARLVRCCCWPKIFSSSPRLMNSSVDVRLRPVAGLESEGRGPGPAARLLAPLYVRFLGRHQQLGQWPSEASRRAALTEPLVPAHS